MPCYELIRINKNDDQELWEDHFEQVSNFNIPKNLFHPKFDVHKAGVKPEIVIFPEFKNEFTVEKISTEEAVNRAIILSHLPSELSNYTDYRNLFNLLFL